MATQRLKVVELAPSALSRRLSTAVAMMSPHTKAVQASLAASIHTDPTTPSAWLRVSRLLMQPPAAVTTSDCHDDTRALLALRCATAAHRAVNPSGRGLGSHPRQQHHDDVKSAVLRAAARAAVAAGTLTEVGAALCDVQARRGGEGSTNVGAGVGTGAGAGTGAGTGAGAGVGAGAGAGAGTDAEVVGAASGSRATATWSRVTRSSVHQDPTSAAAWRLMAVARGMVATLAGNARAASTAVRMLRMTTTIDSGSPLPPQVLDVLCQLFSWPASASVTVASAAGGAPSLEVPHFSNADASTLVAAAHSLLQLRHGSADASAHTALTALRTPSSPDPICQRSRAVLWFTASAALRQLGRVVASEKALACARGTAGDTAGAGLALHHLQQGFAAPPTGGEAKGASKGKDKSKGKGKGKGKSAAALAAKRSAKMLDGLGKKNPSNAVTAALRGWCWCLAGQWSKGLDLLRAAQTIHSAQVQSTSFRAHDGFGRVLGDWTAWASAHAEELG